MKKKILLAAALSFIVVGTAQADSTTGSYNVAAGAGIVGSKHDLSVASGVGAYQGYGSGDTLDRICIFCHAPHHAYQEVAASGINYLPLWNHGITTQIYNTYESDFGGGPDAAASGLSNHELNADIGQPGSVSRLCLSCHDGTVALDTYGQAPQRGNSRQTGDGYIVAQFKIGGGGNLANHHPIGFDYSDVADADPEIAADTTVINPDAAAGVQITIDSILFNGDMECVTCHDVHNSQNTGETFLWTTDRESQFCLVCHLK